MCVHVCACVHTCACATSCLLSILCDRLLPGRRANLCPSPSSVARCMRSGAASRGSKGSGEERCGPRVFSSLPTLWADTGDPGEQPCYQAGGA